MEDFSFLHNSYSDTLLDQKSNKKIENDLELIVVDDDEIFNQSLKRFLEKKFSFPIRSFCSPTFALEYLSGRSNPFILLTDLSFDNDTEDGLFLIDLLHERGQKFVAIAMTGFGSIETAISATKKGVFHYLTKPFEFEVLLELVKSAMIKFGLDDTQISKKCRGDKNIFETSSAAWKLTAPSSEDVFLGMIGRSSKMKQVFERIKKIAGSDSTVLITGPSGTGKELVARAIHHLSLRKDHRMVSVNCGAIPSELLESELFGHIKGSFTGAISNRKGRFELADGGTIFLDEIGDMPILLQVKLLRILQTREVEPVGASDTIKVDTRIITATHRDLEKMVRENRFREDLFYRLNVIPVKVPSLCERREDIPLLIAHFISRFASADGTNRIDFDEDALELLLTYSWPGNVRELENLIERLIILQGGNLIRPSDLPSKFTMHNPNALNLKNNIELPENGLDLKQFLSDIEDSLILEALSRTNGNKNQASKLLQLNRTTLIEKMKKKGLLDSLEIN